MLEHSTEDNDILPSTTRGSMSRYANLRDEELVARFRQTHDEQFFAELFERHSDRVRKICLGILKNSSLAEDTTQDTFLRALTRIDLLGDGCFAPWVSVIAKRLCLNVLCSAAHRHETVEVVNSERGSFVDPGQRIDLLAELDQLPESQGLVLKLFYFDGLTYRQIADLSTLSITSVRSKLRCGLNRLRTAFNSSRGSEIAR